MQTFNALSLCTTEDIGHVISFLFWIIRFTGSQPGFVRHVVCYVGKFKYFNEKLAEPYCLRKDAYDGHANL